MPWTDAQRAAIESRGENLLLSAAAGSGKTTVLVERVLRLIGEGADIGAMLIVTFTRSAASDMRASLIRALEKAALTAPRFRAQAEAAEYAGISTIHSFCIDILRETGLYQPVLDSLLDAIQEHLDRRAAESCSVGAILFTNRHGLLGMTRVAEELMTQWR